MRFRFRYSLRTLLLTLLVLSGTAGLWTRRSLEQRQRVRKLEGVGLRVKYDLDQSGQNGAWNAARRWMASKLGRDWVSVPLAIEPTSTNIVVHSEDCEIVRRLTSIRIVDLRSTNADDECISFISRLPRLESLNLTLTLVNDRGLQVLDRCKSLQFLDLADTLVSATAADEFRRRHPQCAVHYFRQLDERREAYMRHDNLKPDRIPTQAETDELKYWLGILEAKDNIEKEKIVAKHVGKSIPEPGHPAYPNWAAGQSRLPRDWYYIDAFDELGKLRLAAAVPVLERIARDVTHGDDARCGAISALAQIGDARAIPISLDLLGDESYQVAFVARGMLQGLTGQYSLGGAAEVPAHGTPERQRLIDEWKTFWRQNADVLRPRRPSGMSGY